jgi:phosphate transport system substrate-binding protein
MRALAMLLIFAAQARADAPAPTPGQSLDLRGAGTMLAALQELAESYMATHPKATIVIDKVSAERGLKALIVGTADMALAVDDVPPELARMAGTRDVKLEKTCIFVDGVVPVVAPENPTTNLTIKQLRGIFDGTIKSWKELGGPDTKIDVVSHDRTNGAYEIFKVKVLGDDAVVTPDATIVTSDYASAITGNAIGYIGMSAVGKLKPLAVNGVTATEKTVHSGEYPIIRQACLYQRTPGTVLGIDFIAHVQSPEGRAILTAHHGVPASQPARRKK